MTTGLLMSGPAGRGSDSRCAPIMPHAPAFLYRNCRARAAQRREVFMVRVNDAYPRGDIDLLRRLAAEWDAARAAAPADASRDRLSRLRASVDAARGRLAQVRAELAQMAQTELGQLLFVEHQGDMRAALKRLEALADQVRSTIAERRQVFADLGTAGTCAASKRDRHLRRVRLSPTPPLLRFTTGCRVAGMSMLERDVNQFARLVRHRPVLLDGMPAST